ncbi:MAG: hypothetical protein LBC75_05895 [Fibromonadaceae bacterium]|jgi:TolB-like protein|nr:hypothetical protein [Fibromonadaceae bacterium]
MKKQLFFLLFLALAAYGQQERIAIINTMDDFDSISVSNLTYLTDRLREAAVNVLPKQRFGVMTTESIVAFLGSQENTVKVCKESSCLADLGRKVSADYVAQGRIGRFEGNLTIKVELYDTQKGNLIGSFTGSSKDVSSLLVVIDEKSSSLFQKVLEESTAKPPEPAIVVEKPEVAKLEPAPAKPEAEMPKSEKPKDKKYFFSKTSFWVGLGLEALGLGMIIAGSEVMESNMWMYQEEYDKFGYDQTYYDETWDNVQSSKTQRNIFYILGAALLASGIGVHIWF